MQAHSPFTEAEAEAAYFAWSFNCGPGALCAILGCTPERIRPHLLDFERKGYTNPTLMRQILAHLKVPHILEYRSDNPNGTCVINHGLIRIQWAGPWTEPGVPMKARYRMTHWIAADGDGVFDVNTARYGWIPRDVWENQVVPFIIKGCVPKGNGRWWPTHGIEIPRGITLP